MYSDDPQEQLKALHRIVVYARTAAYDGVDSQELARVLDDTEYLLTRLFVDDEDRSEIFWRLLQEMPYRHACLQILRPWADGLAGANSPVFASK